MNFVEVIAKKRDGYELSREEVQAFVRGATDRSLADEQLAAMLMAICIRGASAAETRSLVEAMRDSGECWRLADHVPGIIDKHSTGGVGDTVSLILAPLLVACGAPVAMMAGAGLGHTQGTLDKLAAIPGFVPVGSREEALARLEACGACMAAQSARIAPADRTLYALRDITGTVPSLPLITGSIMSKKLAVGAANLVLDVKTGAGAFCKDEASATALGRSLADAACGPGVRVAVLLTDMSQPLGRRLGTASEALAALEVLDGRGDARLRELTIELALAGLVLAGRDATAARSELEAALTGGAALAEWERIVRAHGGDPDPARLARPRRTVQVLAPRAGFVTAIAAESLGWLAVALGAGRRHQGDPIDFAAGLCSHAAVGDRVEQGQELVTLELGEREVDVDEAQARALAAFSIGDAPVARPPLVLRRLGGEC